MIPKIIHYCWFGRGEKPKLAKKCIASWKKYMPDYEIVEWNEDNFNVAANQYVYEAYCQKKYAFVTDYVRLYVLINFGGIYMDTDVEVLGRYDNFLHNKAFSGFESSVNVPTGIMASEKGFCLFNEFISYYDDRHFLSSDGSIDTTTNTAIITDICLSHGLILNNEYQVIDGFALYPSDYFCPLQNETGLLNKTKNTISIHWFAKSWVDSKYKKHQRIIRILHRVFGVKRIHNLAVKLGLR